MGKQMTYYMEREVFTQLAQIAVDLGCVLFKLVFERSGKLMEVIGANKPNYFKVKKAEQI